MGKKESFSCDRCLLETEEKNEVRMNAMSTRMGSVDLCKECDNQHTGVKEASSHIGSYLTERWLYGDFNLTAEGVVQIVDIGGHGEEGVPREYAISELKLTPLKGVFHLQNFRIGPYRFESRKGLCDKEGKDGYDIFRVVHSIEKKVAIIRWRKHKDCWRWDYAFAFSKDQPGVLLWNESEASHVTDVQEAIQLVIQSLESSFERWKDNLNKPEGSAP